MAALILAIRLTAASFSFEHSRDVLLRGVSTGEMLSVEMRADVVLTSIGAAWLEAPLTLRRASKAIEWVAKSAVPRLAERDALTEPAATPKPMGCVEALIACVDWPYAGMGIGCCGDRV